MTVDNKIRVLHLQLLPIMSGVQKVALDEMALIDRERFQPMLVCKEPGDFTQAVGELAVECRYVPELERSVSPKNDLKALYKLYKLFREIRPDVVHTHSSKTGVLGRIAARFAGVPAVMHTVHGFSFDGASSNLQRRMYVGLEWISSRFCDAILLLKKADLELTRSKLGVKPAKLHLIPNGVSLADFSPANDDAKMLRKQELLGARAEDVCVAMTGRLWEQKNPECFVRAAIEVLNGGAKNVRFYLIGDGPLRAGLQGMIDASGFSGSIQILGWRDDVKALLQVMDAFVLPSRWEGLPLAILEAMSAGLPVVASDIPGNNDLVEPEVTGYLFTKDDHLSLADKLMTLLRCSKAERARLGMAGRASVEARYQIEDRVAKIESLYTRLIGPKGQKYAQDSIEMPDDEDAGQATPR